MPAPAPVPAYQPSYQPLPASDAQYQVIFFFGLFLELWLEVNK
jgi:hypothetical protein